MLKSILSNGKVILTSLIIGSRKPKWRILYKKLRRLECAIYVMDVVEKRLPVEEVECQESGSNRWEVCGRDLHKVKLFFQSSSRHIRRCLSLFFQFDH